MEPKNPKTDAAANAQAYWRENIKLLCMLLAIWFAVSFGAGILFVDALNAIQIGGFKLGFWFAQQGSIIVFVISRGTSRHPRSRMAARYAETMPSTQLHGMPQHVSSHSPHRLVCSSAAISAASWSVFIVLPSSMPSP